MDNIITNAVQNSSADVVTYIDIHLVKNLFVTQGINAAGKPILPKPNVRYDQLLDILTQLPHCIIGMEI